MFRLKLVKSLCDKIFDSVDSIKSSIRVSTITYHLMVLLLSFSGPIALTVAASLIVPGSMAAASGATTLFGGVSHSEFLPPVTKQYPMVPLAPQRGKVQTQTSAPVNRGLRFADPLSAEKPNQQVLGNAPEPREKPAIVWVPIPKQLAGKWIKQGDLTVSYTDLRTGVTTPVNQWTQNVQTTNWGNQIDRQGNIWHGYSVPTEFDGISSGKHVRFTMVGGRRESSSSDHLVTRAHFIVTESLGTQLVDAFQQETLNDLFLLPSGELENHGSTRDFTNEGQPIRQGMLISRFTKVGPFEPVETQDGVDLLKSLNEYLRTHNMAQLVRTEAAR